MYKYSVTGRSFIHFIHLSRAFWHYFCSYFVGFITFMQVGGVVIVIYSTVQLHFWGCLALDVVEFICISGGARSYGQSMSPESMNLWDAWRVLAVVFNAVQLYRGQYAGVVEGFIHSIAQASDLGVFVFERFVSDDVRFVQVFQGVVHFFHGQEIEKLRCINVTLRD